MLSGKEWLRSAGNHYLRDEAWLGGKVAALFDAQELSESQQALRRLADRGVALLDLPASARPDYADALKAAALAEFGPPPAAVNRYRPSRKPVFNLALWIMAFVMVRMLINRNGGSL